MRLATYNVEWFDSLFDESGALLEDDGWSSRRDVTRAQQAGALGRVFAAMDADAVMIVEAPDSNARRDTGRALANFAARFGLRSDAVLTGFVNDTQQEIALLYDPALLKVSHDPQGQPPDSAEPDSFAPRFDGAFHIDLDVDATRDRVVFSKPPLEISATWLPGGQRLRLIGAHLKSKAPHGARTRDEVMRLAIANRRKQLAQAIWLRRRVEAHLGAGDRLIVMGDLNDGPGLDEYEHLFGRSSVEIVLGEGEAALFDPHAAQALATRFGAPPTTSRFHLREEGRYLQALLDYIMISPDLRSHAPKWRIWHPFDDPMCWQRPDLREALLLASDHFPVTLDIAL